jgi:hypothetical protein
MMSNFLEELENIDPGDDSENFALVVKIHNLAVNLGENARRMLEIGIVQDELEKLEFKFDEIESLKIGNPTFTKFIDRLEINIEFQVYEQPRDRAIIWWDGGINHRSVTVKDVISKVKEMINHDKNNND